MLEPLGTVTSSESWKPEDQFEMQLSSLHMTKIT